MLKTQEPEFNCLRTEINPSTKWWTILSVSIGVFIFSLDVYIVNLALPIMLESLHTTFANSQWVVLSYLLAISIFVLSASKLGDIWSKKKLYIIGMIVFTISSLLCGLAPNIGFLIAFRAIQGVGAAFISGLGTAMIVEAFPVEERGLGLGIRAGVFGLGMMLGPTIGGLLVSIGDWPLIFFINVPIGIIGILIMAYFVPPSVVNGEKQQFDIIGTIVITFILTCFILAITLLEEQNHDLNIILALLFLSMISLAFFIFIEMRTVTPILDWKIFKSLDLSLGLGLRFIGNFVIAGSIFILPFFFKLVKQYPTSKAGFLLAIPPIIIVLTAPMAGTLSDKFGSRIISITGLLLMAIGCFLISTFNAELTIINYIIAIIPYGLGIGMFQSPNNSAIMGAAPQDSLGIASGLLSLSRILGQTISVPLVGAIFSFVTLNNTQLNTNINITNAPVASLILGTQVTFRFITILLVISTVFAIYLWWIEQKRVSMKKLISDLDK
ncbi:MULTISPECIES: MFS transporter [Aphanizomenonaceae]|uniref:MFS transporter n=1 Tax=Dolichospermum heterosporum TAC447 TaxID=747523 RepID=A0ABY5LRI4_9CYAN|nr:MULTISPECIES: MFS transporter [Aphanizomenonaceae]MBE9258061.1 MFS transporter [Dolichospermum sp. LEGE 00246]MDK2410152.1 MFS transporter [Aphanizomenon sp. 202]MDK2460803.1 MFS transporter [Aphanizomenon sp. PH219]UUO13183.1 MFS transporter [Dolichospermum heterosporum TAC447]